MNYDSFEEWMRDVDACIAGFIAGLTSEDIEDCNYADMYEDGYRPSEASQHALEKAGFQA